MKRVLALAAVALATLTTAAPAAAADPSVVLSDLVVDAAGRTLTVTATGEGLPSHAGLDPADVTVTVDGRALPVTAAVAAEVQSVTAPRVLLVVDTSGSMLGQPMLDAKQALTTFASAVAPEAEVGMLTFSSTPRLVLEPTTDRGRLLAAVTAMQAQGETALYDATQQALQSLGGTGDRRLVLLSDGGDTASRSSLDDVLAAVAGSGATVDAIGFRTDESVSGTLEQLAGSGRGRLHSAATVTELTAALATTSVPHARALTLSVLLPEDLAGERTLDVSVGSGVGVLTASQDAGLGAVRAPVAAPTGWWGSRSALLAGSAAVAASLLLGTLVLLSGSRRDQRRVGVLLEKYTTAPQPEKESLRTASPVTRTALDVAHRLTSSRGVSDGLTARLERAAVALQPAEWVLLSAGVGLGSSLLLVLLGMHLLVAVAFGAVAGWLGPRTYLGVRGARRQKDFEQQLPDALQMVAGSLSAGYSLAQALDGVVREGTQPIAAELGRALAESRLGVPVEDTLQVVADRMGSRDFSWVVMAVRVQREVGGNLAGILTTVTATMRERAALKRQVRALSAEGRLSAYIPLGLPFFLALYMLLVRRDYIEPLYTTGLGIALIVVALVMMAVGSFVMNRVVTVEV